MAHITLDRKKLKHNFLYLDALFRSQDIQWTVVSKLLCGNLGFLEEVVGLGVKQICDSRIANLKMIKNICPEIETIYIKPPASRTVCDVVQYADISVTTEYTTLKKLSTEALRQNKVHKVIIMVELGELREGVLRDDIVAFYAKALALPNIRIVGVGTNFSCLSGVLPDYDKLNQLALYRELIAAKFNTPIPYVSGGASVTIPLMIDGVLPKAINHFRVGETLFFGTNVYDNTLLPEMEHDVFRLYAEIIELEQKPLVPDGRLGSNLEGITPDFNDQDKGKTSTRAILDVGLLDVEHAHIFPDDDSVSCIGASSDMLILDLGENLNHYKPGDWISFHMDYMGAFRLMHSKYIHKKVVG